MLQAFVFIWVVDIVPMATAAVVYLADRACQNAY
jgi:hypothetical protein